MTTIAAALSQARQSIPASEARLLLGHLLGRSTAWIEAHRDEALDSVAYAPLVARRAAGEPVAYILGQREFYGRDFAVGPAVLIPRPETELLIDLAKEAIGGLAAPRILDLGTGSGCLAVTLALELPRASVTAVDISAAALAQAGANAVQLGAQVRLSQSDWFAALNDERFDLIVANPPYIAAADPHLSEGDLRFEPASALASGHDGLAAIRRIVADAARHLTGEGRLLFEHGYDQAAATADLLSTAGFCAIEQHRDLAGILRVSGGRLP